MIQNVAPRAFAKSNYILSVLRRLFASPFEYFVNWSLMRAFNGAVLVDQESTWQIMFYPTEGTHVRPSGLVTSLVDMTVAAYVRQPSFLQMDQPEFEALIREADEVFTNSVDAAATGVDRQVRRVHLRATGDSSIPRSAASCNEVFRRLASSVNGQLLLEPAYRDDWIAADVDPIVSRALTATVAYEAEIQLDQPKSDRGILSALRLELPELTESIFNSGQVLNDQSSAVLRAAGLSMLHLYSRQF